MKISDTTVLFESKEEFTAWVQYCHLINSGNKWTRQDIEKMTMWPKLFKISNKKLLIEFNALYNDKNF